MRQRLLISIVYRKNLEENGLCVQRTVKVLLIQVDGTLTFS